ncbi:hypothetical protein MP387_04045 [Streptococcus oralis]|uniref:hypothetical protein n=1 Tax=Streptococcus oralis TaxID=1303 RepID=UPI001F61BA88|nr:hypothetical protein [Streptococcus oralis]UNV68262.1 hypothetical protein MP387_04045 [Streptococcus oralis]
MGTKGISKKVFETIFSTASVDCSNVNSGLEMLMRYYKDDIPKSPRFLYDSDAVYFYNFDEEIKELDNDWQRRDLAERGDIMTSIWTPITYYLDLNKDGKILAKNNAGIDIVLQNDETRNNEKLTIFNYLAEHYASRGNLLLLPNMTNKAGKRNLNPDKFMMSEDKLDQFLYYCLKGKLMEYFNNKKNLVEWFFSESLECMFLQGFFQHSLEEIENRKVAIDRNNIEIKENNIQRLIDKFEISDYKYRDFSLEDWKTYFDRLNKVIAYRNSVDIKPHLPLKWDKRDCSTTTEEV